MLHSRTRGLNMAARYVILNSDVAKVTSPYSTLQQVIDGWKPHQYFHPTTGDVTEKSQAVDLLFDNVVPATPVLIGPARDVLEDPNILPAALNIVRDELITLFGGVVAGLNADIAALKARVTALEAFHP